MTPKKDFEPPKTQKQPSYMINLTKNKSMGQTVHAGVFKSGIVGFYEVERGVVVQFRICKILMVFVSRDVFSDAVLEHCLYSMAISIIHGTPKHPKSYFSKIKRRILREHASVFFHYDFSPLFHSFNMVYSHTYFFIFIPARIFLIAPLCIDCS